MKVTMVGSVFIFEDCHLVKAHWVLLGSIVGTTKLETALLWGSLHISLNFLGKTTGSTLAKWMTGILSYHTFVLTKIFLLSFRPRYYAFCRKDILILEEIIFWLAPVIGCIGILPSQSTNTQRLGLD